MPEARLVLQITSHDLVRHKDTDAGDIIRYHRSAGSTRAIDLIADAFMARVVGTREQERVLPVGAHVTVIGELVHGRADIDNAAAAGGDSKHGSQHTLRIRPHPCVPCLRP